MKVAIAGAGLSGATVAQVLTEAGHDVTVYERRAHVAGNCYDYLDQHGIRIHMYGPHIFHTKNERVWNYIQRFSKFVPYEHKVLAFTKYGYLPFPPNRTTMIYFKREELVDYFYRPYTELMWGKPLEEVAPKILDRVPMRDDFEDRYFPNDPYQGLPENGYTVMAHEMLEGSQVRLMRALEPKDFSSYDRVVWCGSPDDLFGRDDGELPYRAIEFEHETIHTEGLVQPSATINYAGDHLRSLNRTRRTEWKWFPNNPHADPNFTVLTREHPIRGNGHERYYPVRTDESVSLYKKYVDRAEEKYPNLEFLGRCGNFAYIDMDQSVNMGLVAAEKLLRGS